MTYEWRFGQRGVYEWEGKSGYPVWEWSSAFENSRVWRFNAGKKGIIMDSGNVEAWLVESWLKAME